MNTRLNQIQNWPELAQKAKWKVKHLAQLCGVSVRTLERHFREVLGTTPAKWLREDRHKKAAVLLSKGCSRKETASEVGYHHPQHFSRAHKDFTAVNPAIAAISPESLATCRVLV